MYPHLATYFATLTNQTFGHIFFQLLCWLFFKPRRAIWKGPKKGPAAEQLLETLILGQHVLIPPPKNPTTCNILTFRGEEVTYFCCLNSCFGPTLFNSWYCFHENQQSCLHLRSIETNLDYIPSRIPLKWPIIIRKGRTQLTFVKTTLVLFAEARWSNGFFSVCISHTRKLFHTKQNSP